MPHVFKSLKILLNVISHKKLKDLKATFTTRKLQYGGSEIIFVRKMVFFICVPQRERDIKW